MKQTGRPKRRTSYLVLCVSLLVVTVLFGIPVQYSPMLRYLLAIVQSAVICSAAWILGASAIRAESEARRRLALAGALLIAPWILFSILAGFGSPSQATAGENELRFFILAVNAIFVTCGLIVLKEALVDASERFYSALGFATIVIAGPLSVVFAATEFESFAWKALHAGPVPPSIVSLSELGEALLFFSGGLTYLATAAFAASLRRIGWLGPGPTRAYVGLSILAVLLLLIRGVEYPDLSAGYLAPLLIVGIPAIAWIMPLLLGVVLLRRAGDEQRREVPAS